MSERTDYLKVILLVLGVLLVAFLVWPINKEIVVSDRLWEYSVVVGHYETTTTYDTVRTCDTENKCTTSLESNTSRDWVTSCRQVSSGIELPPIRPVVKCSDSETREVVSYVVNYRIVETDKYYTSTVSKSNWVKLKVDTIAMIKGNRLGKIYKIDKLLR